MFTFDDGYSVKEFKAKRRQFLLTPFFVAARCGVMSRKDALLLYLYWTFTNYHSPVCAGVSVDSHFRRFRLAMRRCDKQPHRQA